MCAGYMPVTNVPFLPRNTCASTVTVIAAALPRCRTTIVPVPWRTFTLGAWMIPYRERIWKGQNQKKEKNT